VVGSFMPRLRADLQRWALAEEEMAGRAPFLLDCVCRCGM